MAKKHSIATEVHKSNEFVRQLAVTLLLICLVFTHLPLSSANVSQETHSRVGRSILMYLPMSWKSYQNVFWSFANALAEHGHHVTIVLPASAKEQTTIEQERDDILVTKGSVHVIWIPFNDSVSTLISGKSQETGGSESYVLFRNLISTYKTMKSISNDLRVCHMGALTHTEIREVLRGDKKYFDLVIVSALYNEIGYFLAHKLNVPLILLLSTNANSILTSAMGYFDNPSFVTSFLNIKSQFEVPNFLSRLTSLVLFNAFHIVKKLILIEPQEEILHELAYVSDNSSVDLLQLERNASFGMYFTHYLFDAVRPTLPNTVDIGFIHCRPPKTLHTDLSDWFDKEDTKVIYIAFGSIVNFDKIVETVQKAIIGTFADTRYRFLLKSSTYGSDRTNVKTCKWCPQQDILGHQKTALFISHGGFMSLQEAIYHGVPILFLPIFGFDGLSNARRAERQGYGLTFNVSLDQSTDEMRNLLLHTIDKMLDKNATYTMRAKELGNLVRDDIRTPAEQAVFWSEYVMRHAGSDHIKSPARNLSLFYFFQVDVILCFAAFFIILLYILYRVIRLMLTVVWGIVMKARNAHFKQD